jgi:hypothetical protein
MNPKNYALTIRTLEACIADASRPEKLRRMAALRLARLKAAAKAAPAGLRLTTGTTTRTTAPTAAKPAPLPAPTEKAKFEAVQSFLALSRHRSALHRKRRTAGEQDIFNAMIALMPTIVPQGNDPTEWRNFIAQIDGLLSEIKSIKPL